MDSTMVLEFPHHQPSWQLSFKNTSKEPELFYPYYNKDDHQIGSHGYSSSGVVSMEDFSDVSSSFPASAAMNPQMNFLGARGGGGDLVAVDEIEEDVSDWLVCQSILLEEQNFLEDEEESLQYVSPMSTDRAFENLHSSLFGLDKELAVDANLSIFHLFKAYGEAVEMDAPELAAEISRKLREKSSPTGSTLERLAYYLNQAPDQQFESLMEEAGFNYSAAFKAFYQIFPYGRFAHFCANSVILAAVPDDTELVHIVDFDIGTGVQWPPVIESLARRGKRELKLTAIKWHGESISPVPSTHSFEQTKVNLLEYAQASGLRLQIEETDMDALTSQMTNMGRREWLAFNCMVGLPHMGKVRPNIRSVIDFLKLAKDSSAAGRATITFGDGIGWGRGMEGYGCVFEGLLVQFQALLESMDCHFLQHLREARVAMECLLLMPYFASASDVQVWVDIARESKALSELGLEACEMHKVSILEAKELVREGEGSYWASNEGAMKNQMVLGYMGTPLVKVSSWR